MNFELVYLKENMPEIRPTHFKLKLDAFIGTHYDAVSSCNSENNHSISINTLKTLTVLSNSCL